MQRVWEVGTLELEWTLIEITFSGATQTVLVESSVLISQTLTAIDLQSTLRKRDIRLESIELTGLSTPREVAKSISTPPVVQLPTQRHSLPLCAPMAVLAL